MLNNQIQVFGINLNAQHVNEMSNDSFWFGLFKWEIRKLSCIVIRYSIVYIFDFWSAGDDKVEMIVKKMINIQVWRPPYDHLMTHQDFWITQALMILTCRLVI